MFIQILLAKLVSNLYIVYNLASTLFWKTPASFNPDSVTAVILNKNYYSNVLGLVERFISVGIAPRNIYIIDLASANPAVFSTYARLQKEGINILKHSDTPFGPWIIWKDKELSLRFISSNRLTLVTDSDIFIPLDIPADWLYQLYMHLRTNPFVSKAALPLRLSDIDVPHSHEIIEHESRLTKGFWTRFLSFPKGSTFQITDTTIALYKPFHLFNYHSIRIAIKYSVQHLPWYKDYLLTDEYTFYASHRNKDIGHWHR